MQAPRSRCGSRWRAGTQSPVRPKPHKAKAGTSRKKARRPRIGPLFPAFLAWTRSGSYATFGPWNPRAISDLNSENTLVVAELFGAGGRLMEPAAVILIPASSWGQIEIKPRPLRGTPLRA
jgi:hypothetical protein